MSSRLPPEVRKELLLARCAVERAELVRAFDRFREARAPFERIARLAGGGTQGRTRLDSLSGLLRFARGHPYLGSAASLAAGALRGTVIGRWAGRALTVAAAAAAVAWLVSRAGNGPSGDRTSAADTAPDDIGPIDG
jgi:hypothetical protein